MSGSYYDIDEILAEEELIPVTNTLDFRHLAHLDPDYTHPTTTVQKAGKKRDLEEGTKFKMPIWSIQKWSQLGWLNVQLPKHFGRKAREKLDADPVSVDLRKRNERFYMSGITLVNLLQKQSQSLSRGKATQNNIIQKLKRESQQLKQCLLLTFTGARMRRIFDWTLSHIEDDVSAYTKKLTEMEQRLFERGALASHSLMLWKLYGTRRIHVSESALRSRILGNNVNTPGQKQSEEKTNAGKRTVSPDAPTSKRIRAQ